MINEIIRAQQALDILGIDDRLRRVEEKQIWTPKSDDQGNIDIVSDHGALTGLADDDHTQYYNATRHTAAVHNVLGLDHGSLTGRSDDDHTQYLLASGARAMAGDLDMANNLITNIGAAGTDFTAGGGLALAGYLGAANFKTLDADTGAVDCTLIGDGAGGSITGGGYDVAIGDLALASLTDQVASTAIGYGALRYATGQWNTAMGYGAGYGVSGQSSGTANVFIGMWAGFGCTSGGSNLFLGQGAGKLNTSGSENVAIGTLALTSNTTQSSNVAIGTSALEDLTTAGAENVGIGRRVGRELCGNSDRNVIIGTYAGQGSPGATTFSNAVILGHSAGILLRTGGSNILIGYQAGDNLTTGGSNIIIGTSLDASANNVSNELNIGGIIKGDTSANQLGFFGVDHVAQQAYTAVSDPPTQAEVTAIRDAVVNLGLMASS